MDGDVALFSHGQFGAVLGARWIELAGGRRSTFLVGPASLSVLSYDLGPSRVPVIALWNAAAGWETQGAQISPARRV